MIDDWCRLRVDGGRAELGRLIEHDGELVFFQRNKLITRFGSADVQRATRTATLEDGRTIQWQLACGGCTQPATLRGPASTLLAKLEPA